MIFQLISSKLILLEFAGLCGPGSRTWQVYQYHEKQSKTAWGFKEVSLQLHFFSKPIEQIGIWNLEFRTGNLRPWLAGSPVQYAAWDVRYRIDTLYHQKNSHTQAGFYFIVWPLGTGQGAIVRAL